MSWTHEVLQQVCGHAWMWIEAFRLNPISIANCATDCWLKIGQQREAELDGAHRRAEESRQNDRAHELELRRLELEVAARAGNPRDSPDVGAAGHGP